MKPSQACIHASLLFGICLIGLLLRSLGIDYVFADDGTVLLGLDDAFFHARRGLYSFVNFPAVLHFDPYLAYPDGAAAPAPPLFGWATAAVARLFGDTPRVFEVVAAWVSPVAGALFALPAYGVTRWFATPKAGLLAALLTAVLPSGLLIVRLGNFDHHGAVALIAGGWLAASVMPHGRDRFSWSRAALQGSAALLMLFTWSGSLLYVLLATSAQLVAFLFFPDCRGMLRALAVGFAGAAVPTSFWLASTPAPLGGPFSDQTLSWLHVIGLLAIAGLSFALDLWETRRPAASAVTRMMRPLLVTLAIAAPIVAVPAIRESLVEGLAFLTKNDPWARTNPEQLPLFHGSPGAATATVRLGWFAVLVPVLPIYLGARIRWSRAQPSLVVLLIWLLGLTALLLSQVRYGADYTIVGCVAIALLLSDLRALLARVTPSAIATSLVAAGLALALYPSFAGHHERTLRYAFGSPSGDGVSESTETGRFWNELRFAERVRAATPTPGDFFDDRTRPSYGVLAPITMGHLLLYASQRPVPANNLGNYLDADKYQQARTFYKTKDEETALRIADRLTVRYIVTTPRGAGTWQSVVHKTNDSAGYRRSSSGRLRLVEIAGVERDRRRAKSSPRYKLFERVEGARIAVRAPAGEEVTAELELDIRGTPFRYRVRGRSNASGVAVLRVPYSNTAEGTTAAVTTGATWRVRVGDERLSYFVSEADVLEGRTVGTVAESVP